MIVCDCSTAFWSLPWKVQIMCGNPCHQSSRRLGRQMRLPDSVPAVDSLSLQSHFRTLFISIQYRLVVILEDHTHTWHTRSVSTCSCSGSCVASGILGSGCLECWQISVRGLFWRLSSWAVGGIEPKDFPRTFSFPAGGLFALER